MRLKFQQKKQHTIKRLDVDAVNSAIVPTISFPASGFACILDKLFQLNRLISIVVPCTEIMRNKVLLTSENALLNPTLGA